MPASQSHIRLCSTSGGHLVLDSQRRTTKLITGKERQLSCGAALNAVSHRRAIDVQMDSSDSIALQFVTDQLGRLTAGAGG